VEELGKIDLSYKIKGNESGIFLLFNVELEAIDVKKFDIKLRSEDEIIRHLLIRK
jgi:ribosomal protein S6